ncbi:MAG: SIMPL domain-containing protein [Bacteroidales bacterium]|nr:SIMPL domain-containing protein [Candidatus Colimorpha onthohippi]
MKHYLIPIATAIILGAAFVIGILTFKSYDRCVSVHGSCEREVKADRAIFPIQFTETGDNLAALHTKVEENCNIIEEWLHGYGITDEEYTIAAPNITDNYALSYTTNAKSRYCVTTTISLYTTKVDSVIELKKHLTDLIGKSIAVKTGDWENPIEFLFEHLNDIKPDMIKEATQNARAAAEQFAADSHSRLGKIANASQGYFTIENRDQLTPQIKKVRVVTSITYNLR